ncbi:MAG: hypothetical protein D6743_02435, partial [Calditrichaeota bacterium]
MKHFVPWLVALLLLGGDRHHDPTTLVYPAFLHTYGIRKATKTHLMIYTRNKVKVRNPQGLAVTRLNSWDNPNDKKDDDEVTGYGVNSDANTIIYNKSMTALGFYGLSEKGERALNHPTGIAADERGDVYVADTGNDRVVRFFNPKRSLKFVRAIGGRGSLPGQFLAPRGVALDSNGMVYVADTGNHRVQVIRPDDRLHLWFGVQGTEDGQLWHPTGIAVTDRKQVWSYYKDSFIVLIDLDGTRIQKFSLDGRFIKAVHLKDFGYEAGKLMYLAIDYYSNIWVTDFQNNCVHKFDRNLNYLTSFGRRGSGDKEFTEPRGIAIYKRFGQVFIAEKESAQYYWIGTDVFDVQTRWLPEERLGLVAFRLTEPSYVSVTLRSSGEKSEKKILQKAQFFSGPQALYLDGRWRRVLPEAGGENPSVDRPPLPPGEYHLTLKVEPTYSSYK